MEFNVAGCLRPSSCSRSMRKPVAPLERGWPFAAYPLQPLADKINPTLTRQGLALSQTAFSKHGNNSFIVHTTGNAESHQRQNTPGQVLNFYDDQNKAAFSSCTGGEKTNKQVCSGCMCSLDLIQTCQSLIRDVESLCWRFTEYDIFSYRSNHSYKIC